MILKETSRISNPRNISTYNKERKLFMAYLSFFFHAIISLLLFHATLAKNHTDHLALLAIKSSITIDPQRVLDKWNTSLHFCQWEGVTCSRTHPRVTKLNLASQGIVGSLSPNIGNLSFLREIRLENNTFNSVIPPQVGNLFRLEKLNLANNFFEGEVPESLSNCTRLIDLRLGSNKLVGKLPQELSSLVNLVTISIHDNGFTGGIPSLLVNLTSLESISAANNYLGGSIPHALGQLHNLKQIGFANNQLHGTIPPSMYNLTSLQVLSFTDNLISGDLPKDLGFRLPNLELFQIPGNNFTGSIPFSFSNCSSLVELNLGDNGFTGKVNINFSQMPNLWFLGLFNNSLGSSEPDEMNFINSMINCSQLEMLSVHTNRLTGILPSSIGNLSSQLTTLAFGKNFIYGTLPSGIGNLVNLERLIMLNNHFIGMIPNELGNLRNLKLLYLSYNNFTGNFPDFIGNLSQLDEMGLSGNRLEGQIPPNLGNCRSLVSLDLSENNLTGSIPVDIFQLSSLSFLNICQSHLVGPLPQEIGKLKSLTTLDLSQNDLVGAIPDAIEGCISLENLYLEANSFQGPIPPRISALRGIRNLDLSSNNFSGQIPRFLEQLNLSSLNLSFNDLDGEVPLRGIFKNASVISLVGNDGLCGGLPELRLPKCAMLKRSKKNSHTSRVILVVISLCSVLVVAMLLALLFCWQRRKRQAQPITDASLAQPFARVSYGSLLKATSEFSQQNLIGTGTFSDVYKGILEPEGEMVAIKVLKLGNQGASKSFMAECEALKNIRHRNLVKIITSCSSIDFQGNDFKALIYEFMTNGNLERWLHPSSEQDVEIEQASIRLSIRQRVTIAVDVAHAIHYLHQDCEVPIIHCDLKPSNILLDSDMVAHIGDFGLAKFLPLKPHESSSIGIRGTIGYAAPEYGLGSEMTKEGDIYSFGILLLEMMTGKRPTDHIFQERIMNLHEYVKMALPDRLMEIIDPALLSVYEDEMEAENIINHDYNSRDEARNWKRMEEGMVSLARIGLACSLESPKERMDTKSMINDLDRINETLGFN